MRRFLLLILALLLCLSGCVKKTPAVEGEGGGALSVPSAFVRTEDGTGYISVLSKVTYHSLGAGFEAAKTGGTVGNFIDAKFGYTLTFYQIPGLDKNQYLADHTLAIWYAGEEPVVASELTVTDILICREAAISVELFRFSAGTSDAEIAQIQALWFEAENADSPATFPVSTFSVKLQFSELVNVFYSFDVCAYEDGSVYFRDVYTQRLVAVPTNLAQKIIPTVE